MALRQALRGLVKDSRVVLHSDFLTHMSGSEECVNRMFRAAIVTHVAQAARAHRLGTTDPAKSMPSLQYPWILNIAAESPAEVRDLNISYRDAHEPTDILTFPSDDAPETVNTLPKMDTDGDGHPMGDNIDLGELILCEQELIRRSDKCSVDPLTYTYACIAHGMCHIFGHSHDTWDNTLRMRGVERHLLRRAEFEPANAPNSTKGLSLWDITKALENQNVMDMYDKAG
eukprot:Clim_evm11s207 gene=Clim_evmTU11s207